MGVFSKNKEILLKPDFISSTLIENYLQSACKDFGVHTQLWMAQALGRTSSQTLMPSFLMLWTEHMYCWLCIRTTTTNNKEFQELDFLNSAQEFLQNQVNFMVKHFARKFSLILSWFLLINAMRYLYAKTIWTLCLVP